MFRTIAVAIDGSDHATAALGVAIDLTRRYSAQLTVVAVAPLQATMVMPNEPMVPPLMPESTMPKYRALVEAAVAQARAAGIPQVTGICEEGVAADELLRFLADHPQELLVVGSRGLSTAQRLLLGSVSSALVHRAPCPVLVVRPTATTRSAN